jgi:hypothetical protein
MKRIPNRNINGFFQFGRVRVIGWCRKIDAQKFRWQSAFGGIMQQLIFANRV